MLEIRFKKLILEKTKLKLEIVYLRWTEKS